jgi:hypothetical protein
MAFHPYTTLTMLSVVIRTVWAFTANWILMWPTVLLFFTVTSAAGLPTKTVEITVIFYSVLDQWAGEEIHELQENNVISLILTVFTWIYHRKIYMYEKRTRTRTL